MEQTSFLETLSAAAASSRCRLLAPSAQADIAQWLRFRATDPRAARNRERLLESLLPLIRKTADGFWDSGSLQFDDLVQVGAIAALQAIQSYRSDRGKSLAGYAKDMHIVPAIQRAIRAQRSDVRLTDEAQRYVWQIRRMEKDGLSVEEIAKRIEVHGSKKRGMPVEKVIAIRDAARLEHTELDSAGGAQDGSPNAEEQLGDAQVAAVVRKRVSKLGPAHRKIIKALFLGDEPPPIPQLARELGLPRSEVLRIRDEALQQMRDIEADLDEDV
jgi:RNA polymerase sigma factor (sigma-70 family)